MFYWWGNEIPRTLIILGTKIGWLFDCNCNIDAWGRSIQETVTIKIKYCQGWSRENRWFGIQIGISEEDQFKSLLQLQLNIVKVGQRKIEGLVFKLVSVINLIGNEEVILIFYTFVMLKLHSCYVDGREVVLWKYVTEA